MVRDPFLGVLPPYSLQLSSDYQSLPFPCYAAIITSVSTQKITEGEFMGAVGAVVRRQRNIIYQFLKLPVPSDRTTSNPRGTVLSRRRE